MSSRGHSVRPGIVREEVRLWLEKNLDERWRDISRGTEDERAVSVRRKWGARLAEGGWGAPGWPAEFGGRALSLECQVAILEELVRAGAPEALNSNGIGIFGPILIRHGTEEQKRRLLLPMLDHSRLWCQGFSEPNAGSDLASLQTTAKRVPEGFVIRGQKVWTSFANHADYCYALVRTDSEAPKHAGISMVFIEMERPGVEVRPLRNMAGGSEFAEVFFDGVEIPADNLVGELNQGWKLAVEALSLERGLSFAERALRFRREVEQVAALQAMPRPSGTEGVKPQARPAETTFDFYLESRTLTSIVRRILRLGDRPERAGVLAAVAKLHWSELHQRLLDAAVEGLGLDACRPEFREWLGALLFSRGETIYGGTSEIQRNSIARGIGLPTSVRGAGASADGRPPQLRGAGMLVNEEQRMLREGLAALLAGIRDAADVSWTQGFSSAVWKEVGKGGWLEVSEGSAAEDLPITLVGLSESVGAHLVPGPFALSAALVVPLLFAAKGRTAGIDVAAVVAGERLVSMPLPDGGTPADPTWTTSRGLRRGDGLELWGRTSGVPYGDVADRLLVPVEVDGRLAIAVVPPDRERVEVAPSYGIDLAQPLADVVFNGVEVADREFLGGLEPDWRPDVSDGLGLYLLCLDGEALGGAEEALRRTIAYVSQRQQFGVPVGSFQAVKHSLADAYCDLELARGHAYDVAADFGCDQRELSLTSSRLACGRMYRRVLERCIQAHGGPGFTWEQELHLWYRAALQQRVHPYRTSVLHEVGSRALGPVLQTASRAFTRSPSPAQQEPLTTD